MSTFSFHPALPADSVVTANLDFGQPFEGQVQKIVESAGPGLLTATEIALPGQAVAAILMAAAFEMLRGLPEITTYSFGKQVERVGAFPLNTFRHQDVRARRSEIPQGESYQGFTVMDGSGRGMSPEQIDELAEMLNIASDQIRVVRANGFGPKRDGQADFTQPGEGMVEVLLESGLNVADWASRRVLYLPAGSGLAAVVQAVTIHGLSESWPRTIRLASGLDKVFHVQEVVDPQDMRQWSVQLRQRWSEDQTTSALVELKDRLAEFGISVVIDGSKVIVAYPPTGTVELTISSAKVNS